MKGLFTLLLIFASFTFFDCSRSGNRKVESQEVAPTAETTKNAVWLSDDGVEYKYFDKNVITEGNHSYIPFGIQGTPDEHNVLILKILTRFEEEHRDLRIVAWKIEKNQQTHATDPKIFGIWIDHEIK
ncbi:MAG: hypothetical protein WCV80_03105 [Candidatus Paceibacterota bacterium]|jgi:hypothetical protein